MTNAFRRRTVVSLAMLSLAFAGCISVKTESEIKPIHITMDVNLKVDRELDKAFADEGQGASCGSYRKMRERMERGVVGLTALALYQAREGATEEDRAAVDEENVRRRRRFADVAKNSSSSVEAVERRRAAQIRERLPAGAWYETDAGEWKRK